MLSKHAFDLQHAIVCPTKALATFVHPGTCVMPQHKGPCHKARAAQPCYKVLLHSSLQHAVTHHHAAQDLLCGALGGSLHQLVSVDQHHLLGCCSLCASHHAVGPPDEACIHLKATAAATADSSTQKGKADRRG